MNTITTLTEDEVNNPDIPQYNKPDIPLPSFEFKNIIIRHWAGGQMWNEKYFQIPLKK